MKKIAALILALAMIFALTACGGSSSASQAASTPAAQSSNSEAPAAAPAVEEDNFQATMILGHNSAEAGPNHELAHKFKELVEEKSDGHITVEIYPNAQLGNENEMLNSVIAGDIQVWIGSTSTIANHAPQTAIVDCPGIFESAEQADEIYADGQIQGIFNDLVSDLGFEIAFLVANDFRAFSSSVPVYTMDDFKGLDIRAADTKYMIAFIQALGANAVPMPFSEVAVALQQGLVVGVHNPIDSPVRNKFYEFQGYILNDRLMMYTTCCCVNTAFIESLPEKYQAAYREAVAELYQEAPVLMKAVFDEYWAQVEEVGFTVIEYNNEEHAKMQEATRTALEKLYREDYGDEFVDSIFRIVGVA